MGLYPALRPRDGISRRSSKLHVPLEWCSKPETAEKMRWLWELQLGRVLSAMASANDIGNDGQPEQAILVVRLGRMRSSFGDATHLGIQRSPLGIFADAAAVRYPDCRNLPCGEINIRHSYRTFAWQRADFHR